MKGLPNKDAMMSRNLRGVDALKQAAKDEKKKTKAKEVATEGVGKFDMNGKSLI